MGVLKKALFTALLAVFLVCSVVEATLWDTALYLAGESVTVGWTRGTAGDQWEIYEVYAVWEGHQGVRGEYHIGDTEALEIVVPRPRVGFFFIKVRARASDGRTSEWAISTDPNHATVDGVPRGWRIYFYLPAPGSGGVE